LGADYHERMIDQVKVFTSGGGITFVNYLLNLINNWMMNIVWRAFFFAYFFCLQKKVILTEGGRRAGFCEKNIRRTPYGNMVRSNACVYLAQTCPGCIKTIFKPSSEQKFM
jgi:hypothetical protein